MLHTKKRQLIFGPGDGRFTNLTLGHVYGRVFTIYEDHHSQAKEFEHCWTALGRMNGCCYEEIKKNL